MAVREPIGFGGTAELEEQRRTVQAFGENRGKSGLSVTIRRR
jgi:hypothetical protein